MGEALLRAIIETAPDALITIDEAGAIRSFNPAAERLFGCAAAEIIGHNVKALMPSPYREEHDGYIGRYLRTGEKRIIGIGRTVTGQRLDGTTFPMELAVCEVALPDGRRLFAGFIRDITERRQAARQVHQLQGELAHVSRLSAMGEMASQLAHELNQPLTAIMNYVQACRRLMESGRGGPERLADLMDRAAGQVSRAGEIIGRLRQFIAKGETERRVEDVNPAVEEASQLALIGAAERGIRARLDLARDLPPVLIDRIQIQQVVLNLVRNGIDALAQAERRELTIATAPAGPDAVRVVVRDTGPGLAPEVIERLFQPFVTTKPTGMGIGLSICRSIVDAHGGRLWTEPTPGGGATFYMSLPAAPADHDPARDA